MAQTGNSHYAHSMIDMMTSLAVLFILIAASIMQSAAKDKQEAHRQANEKEYANKATQKLRDELSSQLKKFLVDAPGLQVITDPDDPSITYIATDDTLTFKNESTELNPKAYPGIKKLAEALARIEEDIQFSDQIEFIVIEGHTNHTGEITKNIQFSQGRSKAVLDRIIYDLKQTNLISVEAGEGVTRHLSSTGHWWNRPLPGSNPTDPKNRRVEVKIKIKRQKALANDSTIEKEAGEERSVPAEGQ